MIKTKEGVRRRNLKIESKDGVIPQFMKNIKKFKDGA
jgi:hypothetical protein